MTLCNVGMAKKILKRIIYDDIRNNNCFCSPDVAGPQRSSFAEVERDDIPHHHRLGG